MKLQTWPRLAAATVLALATSTMLINKSDATDNGRHQARESHKDRTHKVIQHHHLQAADGTHFAADNYTHYGHHPHHEYQGKRQHQKSHCCKKKLHHDHKKPHHHRNKSHHWYKKPRHRHKPQSTDHIKITTTTIANTTPTTTTSAENFTPTTTTTAAENFTPTTTTTTAENFTPTTTTTAVVNFTPTTTTTTTAANFTPTTASATITITTITRAANCDPTTTATTIALPRTCTNCFQRGAVVSVKLKHIYANATTQCNQIGTMLAQSAAAAGPLMEMHHLFVVMVTIGTPPKEYDLAIDTSSAETWVASPSSTSKARKNHTSYFPSDSTSSENQYQPFTFHNGEGATGQGDLFMDSLMIAEVTVENQIIGVVTSLSDPFTNLPCDGVFALPPFDIKSPSFIDNAFDGEKLCEIIFAVYLPSRGEGELTMGGINTARYKGNLTYIPLPYPLAWQITIEDVRYGGRSLGITLEATIKTTASSILLDTTAAYALYRRVPGAKLYTARHWTFPCDSSLDFSIMMNGVRFKIPKDSINLGPVVAGGRECLSAITSGAEEGHAILGLAFLQNYYTVFDKTTYPHRVGFAPIF